jgi:pimeloyl-ACP methyl ester carboxylesterase
LDFSYFGGKDRPLFGTLHRAQRLRARSASVLLCNPFGEEAVRAHRIYRVLATQLVRAGYAVLRFDYSGTGDSMGEGREATLDAWLDDVCAADEHLRAASPARGVVAVGLRLGGTLAALATARRGLRLRHLVMWDPIVDGAAYLGELAAAHRAYMRSEVPSWRDRLVIDERGAPDQALGAPVSAALSRALGELDLAREDVRADGLDVVATQPTAALDRLRERLSRGARARWIDAATSAPWNSDAALNAAVVPMDIVTKIVERIEETSP